MTDKQARYLRSDAELLRELACMAADALDALRDRSALRTRDVTALRETEADLRAARIRLDVALEAGSVGLYEVDLVTGEAEVDERYLSQLGLSRDDAVNVARWTDLIHPEDRERMQAATSDAISGRAEQLDTEYRMRHADGGWRWLLDRWRVYARDEAGAQLRVAGMHLDITERKQAEERLAALNRGLEAEVARRTAEVQRQAEQLRALASQLTRTEQRERRRLATILHDHIQQILVAAQIQVSRMSRAEDPARMRSATDEAGRLLAEALTASRSLTVELSPPVLYQQGLIGGLNWLVNRMREQHGLAVRLRADTSAEPADDDWHVLLFECARELLLNVVKHAGVEHAEVTLTRSDTDALRLSVADAGAGFDPATLAALPPDAMSFGLFSIHQRLTHMGGRMDLQSAPGRGTRVDLMVPAAKDKASAKASTATAAATGAATGAATMEVRRRSRSCGVLIVDDHRIVRAGLARLLLVQPDLHVVGEAADAEQAIALAAALAPDVIIMDIDLGAGIDGIEATRRVRAAHADITIIGLSMHADQDTAEAMRAAGAAAYVTKGDPPEHLIDAIRRHGRG